MNAFDEALKRAVLLGRTGRHGLDGALEVVGNGHDFAGELGDRILRGFLALTLGTLAHIVHFGVRTQQPVREISDLPLQKINFRSKAFSLLRCIRTSLCVGLWSGRTPLLRTGGIGICGLVGH